MARKKADDPDAPNCMVKGCTGKAKWKGICPTCYAGAKQMIDEELTSWVELQTLGLAEGPTIVKEFAKLKQLSLFSDPAQDPVSTLQQVLEKKDPVLYEDIRGKAADKRVVGFFEVEEIGLLNSSVLSQMLDIPEEIVKEKLNKGVYERVTGRTAQSAG